MKMLRSIEEIGKLKKEGKYKWGKDLIEFLTPYFESGRSYEEIIYMLDSKHEIVIDKNELGQYKYRYYKKEPKNKTLPNQNKHLIKEPEQNKIAQNQESKSHNVIEDFDFEACLDEDIVAKQKREREELFAKNIRGAKW
jgi:hypothetical protein